MHRDVHCYGDRMPGICASVSQQVPGSYSEVVVAKMTVIRKTKAPLDHSFQKERRDLASKGSLGRRRRPSRYDIRKSSISVNGSFTFADVNQCERISEVCVNGCLKPNNKENATTASVVKAAKDQVKRKREVAGKSAVLIQTWERRSLTEKAQKPQPILGCSKDVKTLCNGDFDAENQAHLKPQPQPQMLGSRLASDYCDSRLDHGPTKAQKIFYEECFERETRKSRPELNVKCKGKSNEIITRTSNEPEWISLSKKLCAKFIESHLEPADNDINKGHQIVKQNDQVKNNNVQQGGKRVPKATGDNGCKEPQWVLLSKKLCTKFLEEHIENSEEKENFAKAEEVQREIKIMKFSRTAADCRVQPKEEPEWVSLSRKLRAKFIEGHLDDPDKVSFDSQLNASDLEENFSVPALAQKYLNYRNQTHPSHESENISAAHYSSQNLSREYLRVNDEEKSLKKRYKEISRSMPNISTKNCTTNENAILCETNHFAIQESDTEDEYSLERQDNLPNERAIRVSVEYGGISESEHSRRCEMEKRLTSDRIPLVNHRRTSSESDPNANQHEKYEDSFFLNSHDVANFGTSSDEGDKNHEERRESISSTSRSMKITKRVSNSAENTGAASPVSEEERFRQSYSDDTFETVDLNSNSESTDSLGVRGKGNKRYQKDVVCEFYDFDWSSNTLAANQNSGTECLAENVQVLQIADGFSKNDSVNTALNPQRCKEGESIESCKYSVSNADRVIINSECDADKIVERKNGVTPARNVNKDNEINHGKDLNGNKNVSDVSVVSRIRQFSCQNEGNDGIHSKRKSAIECDVEKCESNTNKSVKLRSSGFGDRKHKSEQPKDQKQFEKEYDRHVEQNVSTVNGKHELTDSGYNSKVDFTLKAQEQHRIKTTSIVFRDREASFGGGQMKSKMHAGAEELCIIRNENRLNEAESHGTDTQKVIISFNVKNFVGTENSDPPVEYFTTNPLSDGSDKAVTRKTEEKLANSSENCRHSTREDVSHSRVNNGGVLKLGNLEKCSLRESSIFYCSCEDEALEHKKERDDRESGVYRNSNYSSQTNSVKEDNSGFVVNSRDSNHPQDKLITSNDANTEFAEETKCKSSSKQRDIKARLRPLGYLTKISNSNHSTNSDKPMLKKSDSTKSHYVDYKDEHLYMNYSHEYGKIRSKESYNQNRYHASAPDLSLDGTKQNEENETITKAESQQEIKVENTRGVLNLESILEMARAAGLPKPDYADETFSKNQAVSSKESFSQTSPMVAVKRRCGENEFCASDDQEYLKDSTSASFCPSDSECSSWVMTRNNSYVINESSSMNESDISDCSLSVKCDYLSSCSNQNTMETRGRSSSESESYIPMRNISSEKYLQGNGVEKSQCVMVSPESTFTKPNCPATPESLRHLFQLPSKSLFPPTLHTSRVFISKEPPPIYASLPQPSSSSLKQGKERNQKTDRSSSLKIRDIAQGIILTFRRFQNISSTKQRHVSPSRYVDVSHLAESHRQVPKEWFSGANNPSLNFLTGTPNRTGHSVFPATRPVRSRSESSGCAVNFGGRENGNSRTEKERLGKNPCSRSSSDVSSKPEKLRPASTAETNYRTEKCKNGDKGSEGRGKKPSKSRSQQISSKSRMKRPESRNVTSISRKVQQMADGTLYLVTTVSGDSSVPGFYSDSVSTNEDNPSSRQTKAAGESNC